MGRKKSDDTPEVLRIELDYPVELNGFVYRGVLDVSPELAEKLTKENK